MSGEVVSSPGFTGSPLISMPRASDSGDPERTSHNGAPDTAFRQQHGVGITIRPISELIPRGLLTRCVRFAPASHPANGNTRFRSARYGFDRAGLAPAGLHTRGFAKSSLVPLFRAYPSASRFWPTSPIGDRRSNGRCRGEADGRLRRAYDREGRLQPVGEGRSQRCDIEQLGPVNGFSVLKICNVQRGSTAFWRASGLTNA